MGIPNTTATTVMKARNGNPFSYWRIGTSDGSTPRNEWEPMREGSYIAVGWPLLSDLSFVESTSASREQLRDILGRHYPGKPSTVGKQTMQLFRFLTSVKENDIVVACDGARVLGVARVAGGYEFDPSLSFPHKRPVSWLSLDEWHLPIHEGLRTTLHKLKKHPENRIEIERRILRCKSLPPAKKRPTRSTRFLGIPGRIQSILERKGQVIVYGPPGTGKTYWADRTACDIAAFDRFERPFEQLSPPEQRQLRGPEMAAVTICTFHPAYGYEDFLEGYRPHLFGQSVSFRLADGVFKQICLKAGKEPERRFLLVIDEINRGDIPRVFGELLTVLELDKREKPIVLPVSGQVFSVPKNVWVIATMNTADRSIALLDTALRRRFGFLELMPDSAVLGSSVVAGIPLGPWLDELNKRVCENVGRDARNLQIGHSYLMRSGKPLSDFSQFAHCLREDIIPLLEEYCYEDYESLEKILGPGLVDREGQRVRDDLFSDGHMDELVQAVLQPSPDVGTSSQVVGTGQPDEETDGEDADDEEPEVNKG